MTGDIPHSITASDIETKFARFAYPIVKTFHRAVNIGEDDWGNLEKGLFDVFESTLKYLSTIFIAQYRLDQIDNPKIQQSMLGLARPSLGLYSSLLRDLLRTYNNIGDSDIKRITEFYDDEMDDATFDDLLILSDLVGYTTPKNAKSYKQMLDVLVIYRNRVAHGAKVSDEIFQKRIHSFKQVTTSLLNRICFPLELPLIEVQSLQKTTTGDDYHTQVWNGLIPKKKKQSLLAELSVGHLYVQIPDEEKEVRYLDLFPFCTVINCEETRSPEIFFLNGAKKSKIEYLCYQSGSRCDITASDKIFEQTQQSIQELITTDGGTGLPEHMLKMLEVSEESKLNFMKAQVELEGGDIETAIVLLEHSVKMSPGYREAVQLLFTLKESTGNPEEAHSVLEEYLLLVPDDHDFLLSNAKILLQMGRPEESQEQLQLVLSEDPKNTEALTLKDEAENYVESFSQEKDESILQIEPLLLFEFVSECFLGSKHHTKKMLAVTVALSTIATVFLFYLNKDFMMALTTISIGIMWSVIYWATFRIRKLLSESRPNFAAFLKSGKGYGTDKLFNELILPIFGDYPIEGTGFSRFRHGLKHNKWRILFIFLGSIVGTGWFFTITKSSTFNPWIDFGYGLFGFIFLLNFLYLISCMIMFHRLLRKLRFQRIYFSLVQHPKLSIRYLSNLSRKISYPLLLVFVSATFTLYLGPFLINPAFIGALIAFLFFSSYFYYSTIFLVRKVIIQNKWRLISRFSVHFDSPFNQLILRAHATDLTRLKELIEMRDFIDSMDVWAEKKKVLILNSILYLIILGFATIGISNLMIYKMVPALYSYTMEKKSIIEAREKEFKVPLNDEILDLLVKVQDVDDTLVLLWGETFEEMADQYDRLVNGPVYESSAGFSPQHGFKRCDWENSVHGELDDFIIPLRSEQHVLILVYNKVFPRFLGMGAGKSSYDIRISNVGKAIYLRKDFIRINSPEIIYSAYLQIEWDKDSSKIMQTEDRVKVVEVAENGKKVKYYRYNIEGDENKSKNLTNLVNNLNAMLKGEDETR